jgi:hypothetical protein
VSLGLVSSEFTRFDQSVRICADDSSSSNLASCGGCPGEGVGEYPKSYFRRQLMVDCSSIEKVDEVRCSKGKCVVGESLLLPFLAVPLLTLRLMPQRLLCRFDRWHLCCPRSILVQPPSPREEVGSRGCYDETDNREREYRCLLSGMVCIVNCR